MTRSSFEDGPAGGDGETGRTQPAGTVTAADGICFRTVGRESVLLDLVKGRYYSLNEVGTRAWELLRDSREIEPAVAALLTEFDVDEERVRQDLRELVTRLAELGLVRVGPD